MQQINALAPQMGYAVHLARSRLEARLSKYDVTPTQTHVLVYLFHHGGQAPQCQLTAFLKVKPSTANGILDRLEEKGMVKRSVSGTDAAAASSPSPKRARSSRPCSARAFAAEERMLRGISPEEVETFRSLLGRIIHNLEEDPIT